mgnify:CR=1 FL=1|tara:strand:- start:97 stop:372 length:276 start_codon:yes stop_codon:yes gene_type:complete
MLIGQEIHQNLDTEEGKRSAIEWLEAGGERAIKVTSYDGKEIYFNAEIRAIKAIGPEYQIFGSMVSINQQKVITKERQLVAVIEATSEMVS